MSVATRYEHIVLNDDSVAIIAGTTTKVIEIVLDHLAYGWSPEELKFQHPHLTMGQIHSAFAYYWDHRFELEKEIDRRAKRVEEYRNVTPRPAFVDRVARRGRE